MVMIADQKSEKARFERGISCYKQKARATTLPHRILLGRFAEKVATLRRSQTTTRYVPDPPRC